MMSTQCRLRISFILVLIVSCPQVLAHKVLGHSSSPISSELYTPAPNLFTGSYQYSIPIVTPKGRNGVEPKLSINYNSSGGSSWVGAGWSVHLGAIVRSTKKGIDYSSNDYVLRLGGNTTELVKITSNEFGYTVNEYREKNQTGFYRIRLESNGGWEVTDKKGVHYYFGTSTASRQYGVSLEETYSWQLESIVDTNGNTMTVTYVKDQGQIYPSQINYTSNAGLYAPYLVDFILEDAQGFATSYVSGFKIVEAKRLKTIHVQGRTSGAASPQTIRAYALSYELNPKTNLDQLKTVTPYGKDASVNSSSGIVTSGIAAPTITLDYKDAGTVSWRGLTVYGPMNGIRAAGDFNGDGRGDVIATFGNANMDSQICLGDGNSLDCPNLYYYAVAGSNGEYFNVPKFVSDYDGDGRDDFLLQTSATNWQLCVSTFVGNGSLDFNCIDIYEGDNPISAVPTIQGDFDGDTYADIYYASTGEVCFSSGDGWNFNCSGSNYLGSGLSVADIDGDNFADLINLTSGEVHYSNGSAASWGVQSKASPLTNISSIGDFNGDGLSDLVHLKSSGIQLDICFSKGKASRDFDCIYNVSTGGKNFSNDFKVGDFNGDGRTDLMGRSNNSTNVWYYCLSKGGNNFGECGFIQTSNSESKSNKFIVGDFSGDGVSDAWAYNGITNFDGLHSGLLFSIENGTGAHVNIVYGGTRDTYSTSPVTQLPFPVRVVKGIKVCDQWNGTSCATGRLAETRYAYFGGYYHVPSAEFRGFAKVVVTTPRGKSNEFTRETSWFHQGNGELLAALPSDAPYKRNTENGNLAGKPWRTDVLANADEVSGYLERKTTSYQSDSTVPYFNPPISVDKVFSIGIDVDTKSTSVSREEMEYDVVGNLVRHRNLGEIGVSGDERITDTKYEYVSLNNWMLAYPSKKLIYSYGGSSSSNQGIYESYFYGNASDCNTSAYSRSAYAGYKLQRIYRSTGQGAPQPVYAEEKIGHDRVGNLVCRKDANGNQTLYSYDANKHFLLTETNPLNQVTTNRYYGINGVATDYGWVGQLKSVTDSNNAVVTTRYDVFGRVTQEYSPLSATVPSVSYRYPIASEYNNTATRKHVKIVTGNYANSAANQTYEAYLDGFGRTLKTAQIPNTLSGGTSKIIQETEFDVRGQVYKESLPYYEGQAKYWTTYTRNGFGLAIETNFADGTKTLQCDNGKAKATIARFKLGTSYGQRQRFVRDGLGRTIEVNEYSSGYDSCNTDRLTPYATTTYQYDAAGRLLTITDANGNSTHTTYDYLGRKIEVSDPDMHLWRFVYDANGNIVRQTDAKNQVTYFQYDALNRLRQKDYGSKKSFGNGNIVKNYDDYSILGSAPYDPNNNRPYATQISSKGRLTSIKEGGRLTVYYYNAAGDTQQTDRRIDNTWYSVKTYVDALKRLKTLVYPDGYSVSYSYNSWGHLRQVGSFALMYNNNASGLWGTMRYGNYTYNYRTYYPENLRLRYLYSGPYYSVRLFQNTSFGYDSAGNIKGIYGYTYNASTGRSMSQYQYFYYDVLDRLRYGTGPYWGHSYRYDKIGNITYNSAVGSYNYNPGRPHAVVQAGGNTYTYDNNGNMTFGGGRSYFYDYENRPTGITKNSTTTWMQYDTNGQRVTKTIGSTRTTYIDNLYECTSRNCTKYIYAGDMRIASISSIGTRYYHNNHQGSTTIVSDYYRYAKKTLLYKAYGDTGFETGSDKVKNKFTGQERDNSTGLYYYGARYYDAKLGRFITADSIVPDMNNPQALNRYSYAYNNPVKYTDPSGHFGVCAVPGVAVYCAAGAAGIGNVVVGAAIRGLSGEDIFDFGAIGTDFAIGAAGGAVFERGAAAFSLWKNGGKLDGAPNLLDDAAPNFLGNVTKGGTTTVYRAVGPGELADIQKTGQLINRGSAEGKYFTSSAEHASDYAKQAVKAFGDQPYTTIKTKVPTSSLPSPVSVDGGIPAYVIPNNSLKGLTPEVLKSMAVP